MLFCMATRSSIEDFLLLHTVRNRDGAIPMPEFRARCRKWCFENGHNPPSSRLITAVMREKGYPPTGERYTWYYTGVVWYVD